jgi:hypothetical protein
MAHPLPLSYNWQLPVLFASVGLTICLGALFDRRVAGWATVAALLVALWAALVALVWARTRAHLEVEGASIRVRHVRRIHTIHAAQVLRVSQHLTAHGPSYRLSVREDDGRTRRYVVPSALLDGGHSTLFRWLLAEAPQAELDRGSTKTLEQLRIRGLVA